MSPTEGNESKVLISIIIPVKNGIATIAQCLDAIFAQTLIDQTEVIVIDSGSSDGTLELLKNYPLRLYQIPPHEFNHGATRNYGVSLARGKYVVMTVQDAVAVDEMWLETLVHHFKDDEVDAVCGGQMVPHHSDKNPLQWFYGYSKNRVEKVVFPNKDSFVALNPSLQRYYSSLDDVNSAYRRSALQSRPFEAVSYGEDMMWAKQTLELGRALVFDMNARVSHYHHQSAAYCYQNTLTSLYFEWLFFGLSQPPSKNLKEYLLILYRIIRRRYSFKWLLYNWKLVWYRRRAEADLFYHIRKGSQDRFYQSRVASVPQGMQNEDYK